MLKNENMYKEVYYLDLDTNAVIAGRIIGTNINEAGYIMHIIKGKSNFASADDAIVFYTKEEAEAALAKFKPINDDIVKIANDMNKRLDDMREQINGKPHFPDYAAEMSKQKGR